MSFKKLNNYISSDQHSKEESLLDYITDPNYIEDPYTAVFHFLFLEDNQSQLIIHQMIEDVPLTRIRKLQKIWENTVQNFENTKSINNKLSTAFKQIHSSLRRLVLKEKDEIQVMRNLSIDIIGKLLSGEKIDTKILKQNFVARIPKLMNDKTQSDRFYFILNDFLIINEFLTNYNKSLGGISMNKHLEFLDKFTDKFLQSDFGKGVLLSGVVLGYLASKQTTQRQGEGGSYSSGKIQDSPIYKQLNFGRLTLRDLKKTSI